MRMWMLPPSGMCRKHLLGEHVELHMLLGSLRRGKNIEGFLSGGLVDPQLVHARHEELVKEMTRRGFRHSSPIDAQECAALMAAHLPLDLNCHGILMSLSIFVCAYLSACIFCA